MVIVVGKDRRAIVDAGVDRRCPGQVDQVARICIMQLLPGGPPIESERLEAIR